MSLIEKNAITNKGFSKRGHVGNWLRQAVRILGLVCTALVSLILAKVVSLLVVSVFFSEPLIPIASKPKGPENSSQTEKPALDLNKIIQHNLFDANESSPSVASVALDSTTESEKQPLLPIDQQVAVKTSLNIHLKATVSLGDGTTPQSSCAIADEQNKLSTYWIGKKDSFAPNTNIVKILAKRVEFVNSGQLEYVELDDFLKDSPLESKSRKSKIDKTKDDGDTTASAEPSDIKQEGDTFKIPRKEFDRALSKLSDLYNDIRATPHEGGGWRLINVKSGSLFSKLGLRRGDVLLTVNGKTIDAQSAMETLNALKGESNFEVKLERRREEQSFKYEIVE